MKPRTATSIQKEKAAAHVAKPKTEFDRAWDEIAELRQEVADEALARRHCEKCLPLVPCLEYFEASGYRASSYEKMIGLPAAATDEERLAFNAAELAKSRAHVQRTAIAAAETEEAARAAAADLEPHPPTFATTETIEEREARIAAIPSDPKADAMLQDAIDAEGDKAREEAKGDDAFEGVEE